MIAIIGGGICGLGIGWRLAQAGRAVTVFDRGQAGRETTWAAAGMLAPHAEAEPGEEALLPLIRESLALWKPFAAELEAVSGLALDYRGEGTLIVALDRDERENLGSLFTYRQGLGLPVEWLSGLEARRLEPHLSRNVTAGVLCPQDHQVDSRKTVEALRKAFLSAGGSLREHCEVLEVRTDRERVTGVTTAAGPQDAETVVVAAGPWSRNIPGLPEDARPPVRPLKGQMLALQMPPEAPLVAHVLWTQYGYLVPRSDGRLLVGATVEEMGFDREMTAGGLYEVLRHAWEALPGIYDLPVLETWAGLRPTSRDDAPILGPTALEGLVMATGHHRNGILLAPVTARAVSDFILSGTLAPAIAPFTLARFVEAPAAREAAQ